MRKVPVKDRLFRAARRSLRLISDKPPVGAEQLPRPGKDAVPVKENKFVNQVLLELDAVKRERDVQRIEYLLGLLHLSYVFLGGSTGQRLHKTLMPVLRDIYELGQNNLYARTESTAPLAYFVSYPRSGNTLATRLTAMATQGQVFSAMRAGLSPFSKRIYPRVYPFARLIKDHEAHRHYINDRCVLIVRDGRDTVASLAFMTLQQDHHSFREKGEIADFIRWTNKSYAFGSWASHAKELLEILKGDEKLLVRYEDLNTEKDCFFRMVDFFDPGNRIPREHLSKLYEQRDTLVDNIRSKPHVNEQWGFGFEFEPGSMFYEWSRNRKGSSWQQVWDTRAKRAFHETGATESLIELGYETDPEWWRH